MKKSIVILSSMILLGTAFESCQKRGEGDPAISLHGRKARLVGEWVISKGTSTSTSGTSSTITTWTENTVTQTASGTSVTGTNAHYTLTIEKDGTWKSDQAYTITVGTTSVISSSVSTGTWNWLGGVGEVKSKQQMVMRTLQQTDTQGSTTVIQTYTGDSAPGSIMDILQLKNKELIVQWNGTSTAGTSTSSDTGEMTFVQ